MLTLTSVRVLIAGKPVLDGVSMAVEPSEVVALIGAPGCGKSTLLRAIYGLARIVAGTVSYGDDDITNRSPGENIRHGMTLVAQGGRVFRGLSVGENLYLAGFTLPRSRIADRIAAIYDLFPRLKERHGQTASSLSGGERQMLALGMGLVPQPCLLLLDEPSTGLSPLMTEVILDNVRSLAKTLRCSIVVVEQNVKNALFVSDRVMVLRRGAIAHTHHVGGSTDVKSLLDVYSFEHRA
jgi:branched-chain amino acid transport system ATP-binding protein